jgi:hypothetical protein
MAKGRIGLDVGSSAVGSAEVMLGSDPPSPVRAAQVPPPPGAVETAVRAKVEPVGVDLVPFALIRAVGQDEGLGLEESDAGGGFFLFTMLGGEEPHEQAAPMPSPPPVPGAPGTGAGEAPK